MSRREKAEATKRDEEMVRTGQHQLQLHPHVSRGADACALFRSGALDLGGCTVAHHLQLGTKRSSREDAN